MILGNAAVTARARVPSFGQSAMNSGNGLRALRLEPSYLWRSMVTRSLGFWLTWCYVLFEYVRPQSIYRGLDALPWSQILILSASLLAIVEGRLKLTATALGVSIAAFTAVIAISSLGAVYPQVSIDHLNEWVNWLLLMLVVGLGVRSREELFLHLSGFLLWNLKMSQHGLRSWAGAGFRFRNWGVTGAPGWFQNSGEFGIEMCVFLPLVGFFAYAVWPHIGKYKRIFLVGVAASALISVVGSSSRGALLGVAAVGLWLVVRSPRRVQGILILLAIAALVAVFLPDESLSRFQAMGSDKTSMSRLTYWKDAYHIAQQYPLFGIGYKNWIPYYRTNYNPEGELPHNFLIEAMAELGFVGALCVVAILLSFFLTTASVRRRLNPSTSSDDRFYWSLALGLDGAMIGFIVSGSFITVLFYPYIWMNVALAMALHRVVSTSGRTQGRAIPSVKARVRSARNR